MRLLLLGCTGFVGRALVPKLIDDGHVVTLVGRRVFKGLEGQQKSGNLNYLQLDPSNSNTWEEISLVKALEAADGVINLAGEPIAEKRWTTSHCNKIKKSRLETTRLLVEAMSRLRKAPQVLINASAIGFYGTSPDREFTESSPSGNDFLAGLCSDWEKMAGAKPRGTRLVVLRLGIVLGFDGGALGKMLPIFQAGLGGPLGSGLQWMSWIHRTDLCELISNAIVNKSWKGPINCVAPNPVSMSTFSSTLAKTIGRFNLLPVPAPILKIILGDGAKIVLEGQNVMSEKLSRLKFIFKYSHLEDALNQELLNTE